MALVLVVMLSGLLRRELGKCIYIYLFDEFIYISILLSSLFLLNLLFYLSNIFFTVFFFSFTFLTMTFFIATSIFFLAVNLLFLSQQSFAQTCNGLHIHL